MWSGSVGAGVAGHAIGSERGTTPARAADRVAPVAGPGASAVRDAVVAIVAAEYRLPGARLMARTRGPAPVAKARQIAMYLAHVAGGLSLTDAGLMFGRDRTTVAHACGAVEDARDGAAFDRRIDRLERRVAQKLDPVRQAA